MSILAFSSAPDLRALAEGRLMEPMGCGRRPCLCMDTARSPEAGPVSRRARDPAGAGGRGLNPA